MSKGRKKININTEQYWDQRHPTLSPKKSASGNHKNLYIAVKDIITKYPYAAILDLGAGYGTVPWVLKQYGVSWSRYVCTDISMEGLKRAKHFVPEVEIHKARADVDFSVPEIEPHSFDIVVCCEVWEHLTDYFPAAVNAYKYLSNNGISIVTIPNGRMMCRTHYHVTIPKPKAYQAHVDANLHIVDEKIVDRWLIIKSER